MVQKLPIQFKDLYVDKKVHHDTFVKILGDNNPLVLFRMYYIVNDVIERQELFNIDDDKYFMISSVTTKIGLKGEAKEQAKIARLKGIHRSPYYKIKIIITEKKSNNEIFYFNYKTSNKQEIYNLIPKLENKINNLI